MPYPQLSTLLATQITAAQLSEWEALLNRVGWPALIIFCLAYGTWKVVRFLAPRVDLVVNAHIAFVEAMKLTLPSIEKKLDQIIEELTPGKRGTRR